MTAPAAASSAEHAVGRSILITGASSGLGEGMALEFARRADKLQSVAHRIEGMYPGRQVVIRASDVGHLDKFSTTFNEIVDELGGIDVVVANAGIDGGDRVGRGSFDLDLAVLNTNIISAAATMHMAVKRMLEQGHGHVVAVNSVAAFRGFPGGAAYSASKAALAVYAEAAWAELRHTPIKITTLHPGFIDTQINNQMPSRPFLVTLEAGSRKLADEIERAPKATAVPRYPWRFVAQVLRHMPSSLLSKLDS